MSDKKYKLFKTDGSNGDPPPCAFFLSAQGCRNGDKCKFSHKVPNKDEEKAPVRIEEDSSDVVSSESEGEEEPVKPKVNEKKKKSNTKVDGTTATPNKSMDQAETTTESSKKKRKRNNVENGSDPDLGLFAKPNKRVNKVKDAETSSTPIKTTPSTVKLPPPPKSTTPKVKPTPKKQENDVPSFRALNLPISSFSTTGTTSPTPAKSSQKEETPISNKKKNGKVKFPLPKSTPEGQKWQNAVIATQSNPKFESIFSYSRLKELDEENGITNKDDWVKARPFGSWCSKNPHAIAIDCEMCATQCPKTGNMDHKALCRLSIVNAMNPDDVLIDTLVKPEWPIVDYRSQINGIKKEDLDNVEFTLSHAQTFMTALCSEETVIIGHAIHNDLAALKMEHHCVVDSALLFTCKDDTGATCSLKDLAKNVMKKEMPTIHCSLNDARTALISIEEGYLKKDGKPDPIERTLKSTRRGADELFVHRIPKGMKPEHIENMFLSYTNIKPEEVDDIIFGSDTGKTTIRFPSAEHANLAFKTMDTEAAPDKTGRMQKRVYLRNGGYAYIRKMVMDKKKSSTTVNKTSESKDSE